MAAWWGVCRYLGCMATDLRTILSLKIPVIVEIGRREMSVDDVMALACLLYTSDAADD